MEEHEGTLVTQHSPDCAGWKGSPGNAVHWKEKCIQEDGEGQGSRKMWLKCVTAEDISSGSLGEAPCCSLWKESEDICELGSVKTQDKRGGKDVPCRWVQHGRVHLTDPKQWVLRFGRRLIMLCTSKTNPQRPREGHGQERAYLDLSVAYRRGHYLLRKTGRYVLSFPWQKVLHQAKPPFGPLPSRHRQDLVPAVRDSSRVKSSDGDCYLQLLLIHLLRQPWVITYCLLFIYLSRFIQNKHECSCMYSKDLWRSLKPDRSPALPSLLAT